MISPQRVHVDATIGWQISVYDYLEDIYSPIIFSSLQYFLHYAIKFGHSAKDRHSNESNEIVIKSYPLQRLQFIKDTQWKPVEEKPLDWGVFPYDIRKQSTYNTNMKVKL